ncbi:MAG: hypothetical protein WD942_04170 [Dehalococcoidia bacterium]
MTRRARTALAWCEAGVQTGVRGAGDPPRWERCVDHPQEEAKEFAEIHFGERHRRALVIGGAGFDPRSLNVPTLLSRIMGERLEGLFVRERRSMGGSSTLRQRADEHSKQLQARIRASSIAELQVFAEDGAVTLGRLAATAAAGVDLTKYSDVVVDASALSMGATFPITRLLFDKIDAGRLRTNLHVMVTASPSTDGQIRPIPAQVVSVVHGFAGGLGLEGTAPGSKLWMPQLRSGFEEILVRVHEWLRPDGIVPVLPFPADEPREGDRLIDQFADHFERSVRFARGWEVDARSLVYADERNPLDFYRTVLRLHDRRTPVFEATGGSLLVLTPVGSKVLSIGALMAAIERNLPVVYMEAAGYETSLTKLLAAEYSERDIAHVWLQGEAYPPVRASKAASPQQT